MYRILKALQTNSQISIFPAGVDASELHGHSMYLILIVIILKQCLIIPSRILVNK